MSGDLATFLDHCRTMAASKHVEACEADVPTRSGWTKTVKPNPSCHGCLTETDRALFASMADEIDVYLTDTNTESLW